MCAITSEPCTIHVFTAAVAHKNNNQRRSELALQAFKERSAGSVKVASTTVATMAGTFLSVAMLRAAVFSLINGATTAVVAPMVVAVAKMALNTFVTGSRMASASKTGVAAVITLAAELVTTTVIAPVAIIRAAAAVAAVGAHLPHEITY